MTDTGNSLRPTVLVTGADGFIGRHLCAALQAAGYPLRTAARSKPASTEGVVVGEIGADTDWSAALSGVEVVIHLAARAHVLTETAADPLTAFRQVNSAGTKRLAEMAAASGARRLVFVSSIGVNGEQTPPDRPFTETDASHPRSPYAVAKWEAEQALWELQRQSPLEIVIVRPPLTYGVGVKGNFLRFLRLTRRGLPLPFGHIDNRRSFVAVENLVSLLQTCIEHPQAANQTFLVSDGQDLSTTELVERLAGLMGQRALLFPVPAGLMQMAGRWLGRERLVDQLWGSLAVDSRKALTVLNWKPPVSVQDGLERAVRWYLDSEG